MVAVDTNVVLRYLLWDDPEQALKAARVINDSADVLITDVVLVETLWTLQGKKYKLNKSTLIKVVHALFSEPNIHFEDDQTVWRALNDFRQAKSVKVGNKQKTAGFADALVVHKAKFYAASKSKTLDAVYTFDTAAQAIPGTAKP